MEETLRYICEYAIRRGYVTPSGAIRLLNGVNVRTATRRHSLNEEDLEELMKAGYIYYRVLGNKNVKAVWLPTPKGLSWYLSNYDVPVHLKPREEPLEESTDDLECLVTEDDLIKLDDLDE